MDARYPGRAIRTRDAIEQTAVVVVGTLVEPGTLSPGPPGTQHVDNAVFRIERTLTPSEGTSPRVAGTVRVSYTRQVFPAAAAEAALERGSSYVLFSTIKSPQQLNAIKIVPSSDEAARVVASAFGDGARHSSDPASSRMA
ncbi:MAG TPA: hypothetical protein VKE51_31290 [Vicinamibacterales bacterium]|nr:hypothetical protein [Vicinamibacterales bacterium]